VANLPTDAAERKDTPIFSGVLRYFPDALAEVARVSKAGNDQHHPGTPLHWDKSKSTDEGDALIRHQLDAGTIDTDGQRHSAKVAWRALAQLQRELDAEAGLTTVRVDTLPALDEPSYTKSGPWSQSGAQSAAQPISLLWSPGTLTLAGCTTGPVPPPPPPGVGASPTTPYEPDAE